MKKKISISTMILLITLLSLTGCDKAASVKSDSDIMNDLSESKYYAEIYPESTIKGIEIIKRQTDVENKNDTVYATLTVASNDESVEGYIDVMILYGLYNDGWILDSCEVYYEGEHAGANLHPVSGLGLSAEDVSSDLSGLTGNSYTDVEIYDSGFDAENSIEYYSITGKEPHTYMTGTIDATVAYYFEPSTGRWGGPTMENNSYTEDWNIDGTYYQTRKGEQYGSTCYHINLLDPDQIDSVSVTAEYTSSATGEQREDKQEVKSVYNTSSVAQDSLLKNILSSWNCEYYIETKGYSVVVSGDYSSINDFDYIANYGSKHLLCIGKDSIAICSSFSSLSDVDDRNGRIIVRLWTLMPFS